MPAATREVGVGVVLVDPAVGGPAGMRDAGGAAAFISSTIRSSSATRPTARMRSIFWLTIAIPAES